MGEIVLQLLTLLFQFSIIGLVLFVIIKYGKLRMVTKIGFVYKKGSKKLSLSFKKFNGFDYYYFRLKRNESFILLYDIEIEKGSLSVEWRDRNGLLFQKEFTVNEQGAFSFTTVYRLHSLKVDGSDSRGRCRFEIISKE